MGFLHWALTNWFDLLQSLGIVGGLLFTAFSLRIDAKSRLMENLTSLTEHHREIWTQIYQNPELKRILESKVDLHKKPINREEELFVNLVILHLFSAFRAMESGMFMKPEGLEKDIKWFFSLPIPKAVWLKLKPARDKDFIRFVELISTEQGRV